MPDLEHHRSHRTSWLRAAVLGANDGLVSTASLIIGVAAAGASLQSIMLAGTAGLAAGAMSMAAGEYVSVSSQADTERADLKLEKESLADNYDVERTELADIYRKRGLSPELATEVAHQLMEHDALEAHARDEIGITDTGRARPLQAAISSALAFSIGAALPVLAAWLSPEDRIVLWVAALTLVALAALGAVSARAGGAPILRASWRVVSWGALAMALTAAVGRLFGVAI